MLKQQLNEVGSSPRNVSNTAKICLESISEECKGFKKYINFENCANDKKQTKTEAIQIVN